MSFTYFTTTNCTDKIDKINKTDDSILIKSFDLIIDNFHKNHIFESKYLNEEIKFTTNLVFDQKKLGFKKLSTDIYKMYETDSKILILYYNQIKDSSTIETCKIFKPYELLFDKIGNRKNIIILYLNETSDSIFNIYELSFTHPEDIKSIVQISQSKYLFTK